MKRSLEDTVRDHLNDAGKRRAVEQSGYVEVQNGKMETIRGVLLRDPKMRECVFVGDSNDVVSILPGSIYGYVVPEVKVVPDHSNANTNASVEFLRAPVTEILIEALRAHEDLVKEVSEELCSEVVNKTFGPENSFPSEAIEMIQDCASQMYGDGEKSIFSARRSEVLEKIALVTKRKLVICQPVLDNSQSVVKEFHRILKMSSNTLSPLTPLGANQAGILKALGATQIKVSDKNAGPGLWVCGDCVVLTGTRALMPVNGRLTAEAEAGIQISLNASDREVSQKTRYEIIGLLESSPSLLQSKTFPPLITSATSSRAAGPPPQVHSIPAHKLLPGPQEASRAGPVPPPVAAASFTEQPRPASTRSVARAPAVPDVPARVTRSASRRAENADAELTTITTATAAPSVAPPRVLPRLAKSPPPPPPPGPPTLLPAPAAKRARALPLHRTQQPGAAPRRLLHRPHRLRSRAPPWTGCSWASRVCSYALEPARSEIPTHQLTRALPLQAPRGRPHER